ncbi:T9SS type B sorting domain-containing protein [Aureisphaera galaxeae]|uniref:T9SS type B sorting domain-containing protein n=1 Tax=Aureisphaera galaxeae TaxID=1538023 RepID=UPI0023507216|nr:T9SS type B sorting domain-containing protein [Aureisphaera galaxeae]MDC8004935.1 T9SS type B sorting domain-containing protein [Aureisphaera galaxeae]
MMRRLTLLFLVCISTHLTAQNVELFQQFNGRYDFTAFGNTLNTQENGLGAPCTILTESSADYNLGPGEAFVSAHLYWSGSGSGDFNVELNGQEVVAQRTFSLISGTGLEYFSAYADVSDIVGSTGPGTYTLSELDLTGAIPNYCGNATNYGGWSIIVIFQDLSLTLNQISLFDGLEFVSANNPTLEIILNNIDITTEDLAKIGFLAWEGDSGIAVDETLLINGNLISNPPLNPANNAFNGTNSYTGSDQLYNMDMDVYNIEDVVAQGDTSITINLTSGQDFVMVNNIITSVNSEIPDATIEIQNVGVICDNNDLDITYVVSNVNSTAPLEANTPIAFYADAVLVGQAQTVNEIPIGGTEAGAITLNIPLGTPNIFNLRAVVDDIGDGTGIVAETNEDNNEFVVEINQTESEFFLGDDIVGCEGTPVFLDTGILDQDFTFVWFFNGAPIPGEDGPSLSVTVPGTYAVEGSKGLCFIQDEIDVSFLPPAPINNNPPPLVVCDPDNNGFADFDLSTADEIITLNNPDLVVTYHGTLIDAQLAQLPLPNPYVNDDIYLDIPITDITDPFYGTGGVWALVQSTVSTCFEIVPVTLEVRDSPVPTTPAEPLRKCDDDGVEDGFYIFDLTEVEMEVYGTLSPSEFDVYYYDNETEAILAGEAALNSPDFSLAIPDPTNYINTSNPETIYILMVGNDTSTSPPNPNGASGCYAIVELELIVDPLPPDTGPFEIMLCDDELNGSLPDDEISTFDLTSQNDAATLGDPTLTVVWFETLADEIAGNPIPDPTMYQNTSTPQTVIGRVTTEFDCKRIITLTLTVLPNPTPNLSPAPIELCDDDDDGIVGGFVLTDRDAEIINGEPDVSILYYETLQEAIDAVAGTEIVSPYTNTTPNSQIVYGRVTRDVPPGILPCYAIVELTLNVIALPDMPDSTFQNPFASCDENGDGEAIFDLTLQDASVLGVQDPAEFEPISYYVLEADAQIGVNAIDPANAFPSTGQTIWVRLESMITGCVRITPFELVVGTFPTIGVGNDLFLCDDEINGSTPVDGLSTFDLTPNIPLINLGDETLVINFYASAADLAADIPIVNPESYQNTVTPQQEIFVGVLNVENCIATNSFFITVEPNPAIIEPTPLFACDDDNDGFFNDFMLEDKDAEITNGDSDLTISYYETLVDAQSGDPADMLGSPYSNVVPFSQIIYARAVRNTPPGVNPCYTIVPMELRVEQLPDVPTEDFINPMGICDDDEDEFATFMLTDNDIPVLGTQDAADFLPITYYESEDDANNGVNAIPTPEAYINLSNPQTIWVRLENAISGCSRVSSFVLEVYPSPELAPGPFEMVECDDDENGSTADDGISTFDLTMNNDVITAGNISYSVSYYMSQDDQDNDNPIMDPTAHQNMDETGLPVNPQDIFVTVFTENGCEARTNMTLRVLPNPTPSEPQPLEICDGDGDPTIDIDDSDGLSVFDLTSKDDEIINGEPDVSILYYESMELAEEGDPTLAIATPTQYENTTAFSQLIYARVIRDVPPGELACFTIVVLELRVNPLPDDSAILTDLVACEFLADDVAIFDLTEKDSEILGEQDPLLFSVSYYLSESDAQNGTSVILDPMNFPNTSNPQPIYVRITDNETGCFVASETDIGTGETSLTFNIEVKEAAFAMEPALPYIICDNLEENDGVGAFTLTSDSDNPTELDNEADALRDEILNGQDPAIYILTYHETFENAEAGIDPLSNIYINVINPQIIYARVTNEVDPEDEDPCFAIVEVRLLVEQLPTVELEEEYRLCVDNGVAIPEEDGEVSPPVIDTGLDPSLYIFSWTVNGEILPNATEPFLIALEAGSYEVTATERESGCTTTATTTVVLSSPPQVYDVDVTSNAFDGDHMIEATASGEGQYEYQLDDGPFEGGGELVHTFTNVSAGTHTVTIRDINGCGSVTVEIGVIDYPKLLTPNQDGFHDTWNIIGIATADPTAKIYIFDRFGKLLKQISPSGPGWNGTYNGNPLPSSDYWFRVEYTEDETRKEFRGHFTLKR